MSTAMSATDAEDLLRSPAPGAMAKNAGAAAATAASQQRRWQTAGKRVALGDLTNVAGGAAAKGAAADDAETSLCKRNEVEQEQLNPRALSAQRALTDDQKLIKLLREKLQNSEKEVDERRANVEWLKENLLLEQGRRERAEMQLSKLQDIEAKSHNLELELASCRALLCNKLNVSSYGDVTQKQTPTNLNEAGVAVESGNLQERLELMLAAANEEIARLQKEHSMLSKQNPAGLKNMLSAVSRMEKKIAELESTIDKLNEIIYQQHAELNRVNEKLNVEVGKVKSLEQEGEQLRLQVASPQSKVGPQDYSASSTEVLHTANTLPECHIEAKETVEPLQSGLKKTRERLQGVKELKVQAGPVKKQPGVIEISDDEDTSLWNDNNNKRSLKSDPSCSGKLVPDFVKKESVIEIDDDEDICIWSYDRKCSLESNPSCSGEPGFVKKEPLVIELSDDEDTSMWRFDDKKHSLKSNPSSSGQADVETVPDCCSRRPWGSAPCFACSNTLGSRRLDDVDGEQHVFLTL